MTATISSSVFIDAIVVKVRDGQAANRPIYAAIGVTLEGDLSAIAEAEAIVRARVREHPQQVTAFIPDDALPKSMTRQLGPIL